MATRNNGSTDKNYFVLTSAAIYWFRILSGIASSVIGLILLEGDHGEKPLALALFALGVFILAHAVIEYAFHRIKEPYDPPEDSGFRDFASAFIATSSVILGLLAVFGEQNPSFPLTIKVGVAALVSDILVGTVLVGLLLAGVKSSDQPAWNFVRYVFNVAFWALSLGLLCIAMALLYE
jgi:hypothetical protein